MKAQFDHSTQDLKVQLNRKDIRAVKKGEMLFCMADDAPTRGLRLPVSFRLTEKHKEELKYSAQERGIVSGYAISVRRDLFMPNASSVYYALRA